MKFNHIYNMDSIAALKQIPDKSINCCVTSPPYWGLRDYGHAGQIGLEESPDQYVENLVDVFREVKRVLKDDGTLWLNLGDSYSAKRWSNTPSTTGISRNCSDVVIEKKTNLPDKNLVGIPWKVAFALQADGWYLRQDIIWAKPNPMPESVKDRCTKSHEYIFLLSKQPKYYYDNDAIKEPVKESSKKRLSQDVENQLGSNRVPGKTNGNMKAVRFGGNKKNGGATYSGNEWEPKTEKANKRDVWTVTTKPFKEAHFAVFPPDLIRPCVLAGCPPEGIVLDPFLGSGTTALVALEEGRNYIGIELNPEYVGIAEKRLSAVQQKIIAG